MFSGIVLHRYYFVISVELCETISPAIVERSRDASYYLKTRRREKVAWCCTTNACTFLYTYSKILLFFHLGLEWPWV